MVASTGDERAHARGHPLRPDVLFHVLDDPERFAAEDPYRPPRFAAEGFVHLSTAEQLPRVAVRFYGEHDVLEVAVLSHRALASALRWEPPAEDPESSERFPHYYAPLPKHAVLEVRRMSRGPDGWSFSARP